MTRSRELLHNAEKLPPNVQATMMELHRLRSLEILASRLASRKSDFVFDYMGDYDGLTSDFTAAGRGFLGAFQVLTSGLSPDVKAHRFQ